MHGRTINARSVDTQTLIDHLTPIEEGRVVSYEELSNIIGRNVQTDARSNLYSARRWLLHNKGILFDPVLGFGIKRCSDREKVQSGLAEIPRIRRHARRAVRKITSVESYDKLPADMQVAHNTALAQLTTTAFFAGRAGTKAIKAAVEKTQSRLSLGTTIDLFARKTASTQDAPPI